MVYSALLGLSCRYNQIYFHNTIILKLYFVLVKYVQESIPLSMVLIVLQYDGNKFSPKQYRKLCRTSNHEHSSAILFIRPYIILFELFDARDKR